MRRKLFTNTTVTLDLDAYRRFCTQQGSWTGGEHRVHILRWYLLMLLTGEFHPTPSGAASHFAWNCTEFRFRAPATLRAFLHEQAQSTLTHHRIHEPVTWEPPADPALGVPVPDEAQVIRANDGHHRQVAHDQTPI
ncbi:hypothetical protein ABZS86_33590 [Streptomyces sp. NPDC005355]|uniref:hypothetical protein n=1 Tax=Streptomyces sp. NPDC005355 TaxID=3157038 RepID=UPI0033BE9126